MQIKVLILKNITPKPLNYVCSYILVIGRPVIIATIARADHYSSSNL